MNMSDAVPNPKKRKYELRRWVWDYFTLLQSDSALCSLCNESDQDVWSVNNRAHPASGSQVQVFFYFIKYLTATVCLSKPKC